MLSLNVEQYCSECPFIKPIATCEEYENFQGENEFDITISCEYCDKCKAIAYYIEKSLKKK